MASLSVRASSIKNNDDMKKRTDVRFMLLKLPTTKIFTSEQSDSDAKKALDDFKHEYSTAKKVDQQLSAVNKMLSHFTSPEPWSLSDDVLCQVLADLYLNAPMKHPLRSILTKALHKESTKKGVIITNSISNAIIENNNVICESLTRDEFNTDGVSFFIASLNGCFENFPEATAAVKSCFPFLLESCHKFITIFKKMLQNKNSQSPARRSELFIDLHNTIRLVLSEIQQLQEEITDPNALKPILTHCWMELLENPAYADSPIDTKVNCGILKVNYDRLFGDPFAPRDKILTQFVPNDGLNSLKSTPVLPKDIFYAVAVINTMTEKDFSDPNFFPALKVIIDRLIAVGTEFTIDSCLIMAVTRALVQCSKRLITVMRRITQLPSNDAKYLREAMQEYLGFVWINVHHSVDSVRYLTKDLLKNLLKLGQEHPQAFGEIVNETVNTAKSNSTSDSLTCLLLDYLCQVFTTEYVIGEIPNIQERILKNLFKDSCWASCYEQLMTKSLETNYDKWCTRWIHPLMQVDASEWKNDFDRLKIIRNLFERALKAKPEAADYILADSTISIEIYLFVLWIMRRSGRKIYAPENYRASADQNVVYAKVHPSDEIRILAFRILIECHKKSSQFPVEDFSEILEFLRYNCNAQNPAIRQQINTTMKRAMIRIECGYLIAKRCPSDENTKLCNTYQQFLRDLVEFCVNSCLFEGSNFGRRATGLATLLYAIDTWQKLMPDDSSIYTEKLWMRLQNMLSDSYVVNKDVASDILLLCWKFYPDKSNLMFNLDDLKKFVTTFRPYDVTTAAHYLVFCAFSQTYFDNYYDVVIWCENLLADGLAMAKKSLLQTARYNALYGLVLSIRHLLKRIDFSSITDQVEIKKWRSFFQRMIPTCKELTDVAAPVVNSSAPEGHLPNDLNDVSHYLSIATEETSGSQIKVTSQMILLCAWRTVRESALLLGEIALNIPVLTSSNPNGFITVGQLLKIGSHFQQLLVETKHRGAFEQSFLGFSNFCLRLWRSHEPQLHSYPMKLVEKIAAIVSGEKTDNEPDAELDVKKLCATRRSAGVPFMVQGIVTTESQVCSNSALTFCMRTFLNIAKAGPVEESRTHSLNILRALFRCAELGEAVSEYISDGIECSIRGYSAPSWPERNSSTLLFSALMIRVFGVQRTKESENMSIKNKMTGRLFFIRYPSLYDFFYVELKAASEAIERNERPPRLHPLLLLISRLYPSALEGSDSNLKLSTYIPFISTCSSSPELVTRQLSAKSMVALIPSSNVVDRMNHILGEINDGNRSVNAVHGFLLQILYLLRSTKQQHCDIDVQALKELTIKLVQLKLPLNNITGKTYLEILLEILLNDRVYPIDPLLMNQLIEVRNKFADTFTQSNQYGRLTQSYMQKSFTIFNLLISSNLELDLDASNELPIVPSAISNTQNELLETQLNVKFLLLCQSMQTSYASCDFSRYEVELAKFLVRNHRISATLLKLLPSIRELYYIIDNPKEFYPFGVIKAYEILSMLITPTKSVDSNPELKRLTIDELTNVMTGARNEDGVDEVADSMWKYIAAHLNHCQMHSSLITTKHISDIILYTRNITECYKSSSLRQTATEVLAIIARDFKQTKELELLTDFAELLLSLLRDDDTYVRNRTSEIVMDLIRGSEIQSQFDKVIPLAGEDHLLEWLDRRFVEIAQEEVWSQWLRLLRLVHNPEKDDDKHVMNNGNEDSNLVDVDIFDDTEPNTFDETIYTSYKCYNYLIKHIDQAKLSKDKKQQILIEFPTLINL